MNINPKIRLAIFLNALWILLWTVAYFMIDGNVNPAKLKGFITVTFAIPFVANLGWWAWSGFKDQK